MTTHVFYAPHADDEAIAFAGTMLRCKELGHDVVLVLLTESLAAGRIARRMKMAENVAHTLRRYEFRASGQVLGATRIEMCNFVEPVDIEAIDEFQALVRITIQRFDNEFGVGTVHHLVAGESDAWPDGTVHPAHAACERAALELKDQVNIDLHHVYVYSHPSDMRAAPEITTLTDEQMALKRKALRCHSYGYRSVQSLMEAVAADNREFVTPL